MFRLQWAASQSPSCPSYSFNEHRWQGQVKFGDGDGDGSGDGGGDGMGVGGCGIMHQVVPMTTACADLAICFC